MMSVDVMARLYAWRGRLPPPLLPLLAGTRESAFQFYYPPWHDLDNEILRGVFWPPSELHSTIIEIRMKRILSERALQSRDPVDDRGRTWAKPPGAEGVCNFFTTVTNLYKLLRETNIILKSILDNSQNEILSRRKLSFIEIKNQKLLYTKFERRI